MISMIDKFRGKRILVTGGAGSIGSQIVKHLLTMNPEVVRVLDNNEYGVFNLQQEVSDKRLRFFIGDIRDRERIKRAMENIDIVFHAAALKHVPLCEYNPFEALQTNVVGTQNVIDEAMSAEVEKFINISTDKAAHPTNVMGATKLLAEKLTCSANYYKGKRKTVFSSVRFGNVLESSGSVIPLFRDQVKKGGPITVTDPKMTRFMMSKSQAVDLILKAAANCKGGEIFILKMDSLNIGDLAQTVLETVAPKCGIDPKTIAIKSIGMREGERTHEKLMTEEEGERALETDDMFIILPEMKELVNSNQYNYEGSKKASLNEYTSKDLAMLSVEAIKKLLSNEKLL